MTGPHDLPLSVRPSQFFGPAPVPAYIPQEVDMTAVGAELADGGVAAPPGADVAALRQVVADARGQGIDLKIVVLDVNLGIDTPLRDIATVVGQQNPGSTVLVLNPMFAGTYSATFDRVLLEAGEDVAKTGNPVVSAQNFLSQLNTPIFPWTEFTIFLTVAVLLAALATRILQVRSKHSVVPQNHSEVSD